MVFGKHHLFCGSGSRNGYRRYVGAVYRLTPRLWSPYRHFGLYIHNGGEGWFVRVDVSRGRYLGRCQVDLCLRGTWLPIPV